MVEFTGPPTESEYIEMVGTTVESEFDEVTAPATSSKSPGPITESELDESPVVEEDLSVYIQPDGTYLGPTPVGDTFMEATIRDLKKVYNAMDSCKTVDEIAANLAMDRAIVLECVQALVNDFGIVSQDDDRFCNIAAVGKMQKQFDKICISCGNK